MYTHGLTATHSWGEVMQRAQGQHGKIGGAAQLENLQANCSDAA